MMAEMLPQKLVPETLRELLETERQARKIVQEAQEKATKIRGEMRQDVQKKLDQAKAKGDKLARLVLQKARHRAEGKKSRLDRQFKAHLARLERKHRQHLQKALDFVWNELLGRDTSP